jgi:nucleotide-binding universal stress UspA family protein
MEKQTMRKILVCSDLSDRSHSALMRALELAQNGSAVLTICSVLDDDFPAKLDEALKREAVESLLQTCKALGHDEIDVIVEIGEPATTILSIADRIDADLLVLGSHRHRPISWLMGRTTTKRLLHASHRPILIVPNPVKSAYSRILSGVDVSSSCEAAMKLAQVLVPSAEFTTFHAMNIPPPGWFKRSVRSNDISSSTNKAKIRLDAWWKDRRIPEGIDRPFIIPKSVPAAFQRMHYEVTPDLVAIGAHGRSGSAHHFLGSFTETIIRWQCCDVLVVRD